MAKPKNNSEKTIESFRHNDASRRHIPTAEYQSIIPEDQLTPIQVAYQRSNPNLDPQLIWRGKDLLNESDLVVQAPPIYIQEKIHSKVLIDDLRRQTEDQKRGTEPQQMDFFADFNGLPEGDAKTEFYQHDANWSNRMILGDSLQVMASLAEREGLRGQVQMIYIDPPYGIKFNSNFQWSTTSRSVSDGKTDHITREPEQVKAFRDTWRDGKHSYLTYLRDRFIIARDLLTDSGSLFIQISDENVHLIRTILDEVFGSANFCSQIPFLKTSSSGSPGNLTSLSAVADYLLWYSKDFEKKKFHELLLEKQFGDEKASAYNLVRNEFGFIRRLTQEERINESLLNGLDICRIDNITSQSGVEKTKYPVNIEGKVFKPNKGVWKTGEEGMKRLLRANRVAVGDTTIGYIRRLADFPAVKLNNLWNDTTISGASEKIYVVQTSVKIIERCMLLTSDPGDLVLDPTCGSGTTAFVAEQWGRRWITIDTSRVALALARMRIMGARFPYYQLKDSKEGQYKEAELSHITPSSEPTYENIRHGFVYERVPHIMLKSIANNAEIDIIYETYQAEMEPIRNFLNSVLTKTWEEWEIPREKGENWPFEAKTLHEQWWKLRIERQEKMDKSIVANANYEFLYDKPYENRSKVRVAGPFTFESLSPHRTLWVDENDELSDPFAEGKTGNAPGQTFEQMILENLKTAGVQQAHKEDKFNFFSLAPWPGNYICAEGRYFEGGNESSRERRAGIFIGPEFGTVARPDLVAAAREAGDAGFDVLVACAFNYDAHSTDFSKLGSIPVLKARMNADLHMADDLKNTGKGNLFVIFGEPDINIMDTEEGQIMVKINGVDVFDPTTGEVRSDSADGIACWFIDTDYNEESFFVRHAYFLGANDPYSALKTTLKAEINEEAWESLHSDMSRPFDKPASGRIAVKVINHLGDEVMKVFKVN